MLDFKRQLKLINLLKKKSFFLLGPRSTGKSFLIRHQLDGKAVILDLLRSDLYLRLATNPGDIESIIDAEFAQNHFEYIVIDEVQKIPQILDEVHRLIETRNLRFLLTGSSARKLKYGQANLLAGRAWKAELFPLCFPEIPDFNLDRYLRYGGLPVIYSSEHPEEELNAYVQTYLREEIQAEGLVRKLPQFSRFLTIAALTNGEILNFSQLSSDIGVPASTIREYYSILEDTLIGFQLPPWTESQKRKAIATAKFYLFDTGVTHALSSTQHLDRNSDLYGKSFEHWIAMELRSYLSYRRRSEKLTYWRSTHQHEVDFIIGNHTAIEVKASRKNSTRDFRGIQALDEENIFKQLILVTHDPVEMKKENIFCMYWRNFIERLWSDQLF